MVGIRHKKPEPADVRGPCIICGIRPQRHCGKGKYGVRCRHCHESTFDPAKIYKRFRKEYCELCGFKGHYSQFDVDHIDGNSKNNEESNLQTLCSNCHRLKSFLNKDWIKNKGPSDEEAP